MNTRVAARELTRRGHPRTAEQVAEMANNEVFNEAKKDSAGRWQILEADIDAFVRHKQQTRTLTIGTMVTIVALLAIVSVTKDGLDLFNQYILPLFIPDGQVSIEGSVLDQEPSPSPSILPTATTAIDTATPIQPVPTTDPPPPAPLPALETEKLGVALYARAGVESADELVKLSESEFRSVLAETGLTRVVDSTAVELTEDTILGEVARSQNADLGVSIEEIVTDQGKYTVVVKYYLIDPAARLGETIQSIDILAEALLEPFVVDSLKSASDELANRLGALTSAMRGYNAIHEGNFSECARRFTAVLDLSERLDVAFERSEVSHSSLASCLGGLNQPEGEKEHYDKAIEINPNYSIAYHGLGNHFYQKGDHDRAREYYQIAIEKSYSDPLAPKAVVARAHIGLGNIAFINKDHQEALFAYDKAVAIEPDHPAHYMARGRAKAALMVEGAKEDFELCIELSLSETGQSEYFRQIQGQCQDRLTSLEPDNDQIPFPARIPTRTVSPTKTATPRTPPGEFRLSVINDGYPSIAINVRSGPGLDYSKLGYLVSEKLVPVLGRTITGTWYLIEYENGNRGWVSSSLVQIDGLIEPLLLPIVATVPPTNIPPAIRLIGTPGTMTPTAGFDTPDPAGNPTRNPLREIDTPEPGGKPEAPTHSAPRPPTPNNPYPGE